MWWWYFVSIIGGILFLAGLISFIYEIRHAPTIEDDL